MLLRSRTTICRRYNRPRPIFELPWNGYSQTDHHFLCNIEALLDVDRLRRETLLSELVPEQPSIQGFLFTERATDASSVESRHHVLGGQPVRLAYLRLALHKISERL